MDLEVCTDGSIVGSHWAAKSAPKSLPHIYGGFIIFTPLDIPIHWSCWDMGEGADFSANVAEYGALRSALHWVSQNFSMANLKCYTDSQVVQRQMTGDYNCHNKNLLTWRDECRKIASKFPSCSFHWHRREEPKARLADFCSKMLQTKYGGKIPKDWGEFVSQMNTKVK
jgi:ribonuclease HI